MIQFFINNIEIVLPEDFAINTIDENPVFTGNGEFTLDIDTSLMENQNARAFNLIQRLNVSTITESGDCRMIDDGQILNGKFTVLSNTDTSVKWQFIAGNSELNYIIGGERKIWELDFGTEPKDENHPETCYILYSDALNTINNPSWLNRFVCAPIKINDAIWNDWNLTAGTDGFHVTFNEGATNAFKIEPYLMYYIDKLPSLLGYTLIDNDLLSDERALQMYLPNNIFSFKYSDFLPDWTVVEFITEIEKFFNVFFLVNKKTNEISIKKLSNYIADATLVKLTNVLDSYTRDITSDFPERFNSEKYSYDKSDLNGYSKYNKLNEDIVNQSELKTVASQTALKAIAVGDLNKFEIHEATDDKTQFIYSGAAGLNLYRLMPTNSIGLLNHVNKFRSSGLGSEMNFKIVPATMVYTEIDIIFQYINSSDWYKAPYQMPYKSQELVNPVSSGNLLQSIENNESIETKINRESTLEVALFNGNVPLYCITAHEETNNVLYPFPYVDNVPEYGAITDAALSSFLGWSGTVYIGMCFKTLRLIGIGGLIEDYYSNQIVDFSKIYKFERPDSKDLRSENLFEYENQKYIPIRFEREKSDKPSMVTGYFYRMI